jgi:RsmE family RNA methyltransferase
LVAHPRAADPIERVVQPGSKQRVVVAIGPEGGWIDSELRSLETSGFVPVRFSERVLSVESAAAALLAQLELLRRGGGGE